MRLRFDIFLGAVLLAAGIALTAGASAQTVSLSGSLGSKALLVIDGKPRSVAVGASVEACGWSRCRGSDAVVEVQGKRVEAGPRRCAGQPRRRAERGGGSRIVLSADGNGHFFTGGTINGQSVRFIVDTGATNGRARPGRGRTARHRLRAGRRG